MERYMRLSIFNDEIGLDLTRGLSHFREWGLEWIDLRGRVIEKWDAFSRKPDSESFFLLLFRIP